MPRAHLFRWPLDCNMRDWFRILIMFSVCQFGTAPETGKHADATFDAGVVFLLKQKLASQAQCADNPITLSYADQRHHEFTLERSDDVIDLGIDFRFSTIYALRI